MEEFNFQTQADKEVGNFCSSVSSTPSSAKLHFDIQTPLLIKNENIDIPNNSNSNELVEQIYLRDLPYIPREQLFERDFSLRQPTNIEVTSVDVASHGCFVICGCSNGQVLLFDLSQPNPNTVSTKSVTTSITFQQPQLIGHIKAKGIHTNLLLTVVITEDCRYCFAGVIKGSSELLAIDLGRLPVDPIQPGRKATGSIEPRSYFYADTVTYIHSDPKLRGFGAAALVSSSPSVYDQLPKYRLACGRGIKNVHVWQFSPARSAHHLSNTGRLGEDGTAFSPFQCGSDSWVCMYDVATNGNTITGFAFRHGATELLTKSGGSNLRVWNLRSFDPSDAERSPRPAYEDIANTQDTKNIVPGYAFGGTYEFAIVRIDAPKEANRDAFYMPEKVCEEDNGLRRRRTMREVESILSTQDGNHILILCTDGCVMYYPNLIPPSITDNSVFSPAIPSDNLANFNISSSDKNDVNDALKHSSDSDSDSAASVESDLPTASTAKLQELTSLHRDIECDQAWALKRVGRDGDVILARAYRTKSSVCRLSINLLSCETKGDVKDTSVPPDYNWNTCGYYVENNDEKVREEENVDNIDFGIAVQVPNLENEKQNRPQKRERDSEKPKGRPPRPILKTTRPDPAHSLSVSGNGYGRGVNSSNAFLTPECDLNGTSPHADADMHPYMQPSSNSITLTTPSSQGSDTLVKVNLNLDLRTSPSSNVLGGTDSPLLMAFSTHSNPNQQPKKRVVGAKHRPSKHIEEALNSDEEKEKEETASDKKSPERDSTRSQAASHTAKKSSSSVTSCLGSHKGPSSFNQVDETFVVPKRKPSEPLQLRAPPPKVLRVVNSMDVHAVTGENLSASEYQSNLKNTFSSWLSKLDSIVPDKIVLEDSLSGMGPQVQRRLSLQTVEQDRLKIQFLSRTEAYLLKILGGTTSYPIALTVLEHHLQEIVTMTIQRQQMELDTAFAMDRCLAGQPLYGASANISSLYNANFFRKVDTRLTVAFRHRYMFAELKSLQKQLNATYTGK